MCKAVLQSLVRIIAQLLGYIGFILTASKEKTHTQFCHQWGNAWLLDHLELVGPYI